MATDIRGHAGGTGLPSIYTHEKGTTKKLAQRGGVAFPAQPYNRIPTAFVDTPRLQHSTMTAAHGLPIKQHPVSATLPVTLSSGGYLSPSTPPPATNAGGGFAPSSPLCEFTSEHPSQKWRTAYTPQKIVTASIAAGGPRGARSSLPPPEVTYTACMEDHYSSCPLELHGNNTVGYRLIEPLPEAMTTVTRYRLPRSAVPKVLPMKEVEYCTGYHGRNRLGLQPSVTTVSRFKRGVVVVAGNCHGKYGRGCHPHTAAAAALECTILWLCSTSCPLPGNQPRGGMLLWAEAAGSVRTGCSLA